MSALRLGIVGPGLIWDNRHRGVVLSMPESFEVAAFSSRTEATLRKAGGQVPQARLFTDYSELFRSPEVDAVVLLTPIPLNGRLTLEALDAGKPVFVEKPFALSTEEGRSIVEAETRTGYPVYVLEQAPYAPVWDRIAADISAGRIGQPATYERVKHVFLDAEEDQTSGYGQTQWRIDTQFPLGNLFDGGIHDLAVYAKLFGSPKRVRARGRSFRESYGEYDQVSMLFSYPDGMTGYYSHSALLGGERNYFTIRGTEGLIHVSENERVLESKRGTREELPGDGGTPHERMWAALAEAAAAGREAPYTSHNALRDLSLLERIAESLHTDEEVEVG